METAVIEKSGAAGPVTIEMQDTSDSELGASSRQFVTFVIAGEAFAFPMACVREIIRMTDLVRVPLSPPSLEGLANLRGKVLPVISLRHTFKVDKIEHSDQTRVIVVDSGGVNVGFVVDRVSSVITVELERIEAVSAIEGTIDSGLLAGMIKGEKDQSMTMLLDAVKLVESEFSSLIAQAESGAVDRATVDTRSSEEIGNDASAAELQLVSFTVMDQEYAFPMESVQEIVQVPSSLCHVPNARSYVLGVMTLRNKLLPIVSLRQMFHLPVSPLEEHNRIVVISLGGSDGHSQGSVGIVMDRVNRVLRLPKKLVDALPPILAQDQQVQDIDAICRLDDGKRLVSVISVEKLFQHEALSEAISVSKESQGSQNMATKEESAALQLDDDEQMVVFKLGSEEYAVLVTSVQEILRLPEQFTHVPKTVNFIEGLISLRGAVLPVIELRKRFGLAVKERDERQRIMVFMVKGVRTGMIVDSVSEVLKISRSKLEEAPSLSDEQARMIRRVVNLEERKRMLLVLEIDELLSNSEAAALESNVKS